MTLLNNPSRARSPAASNKDVIKSIFVNYWWVYAVAFLIRAFIIVYTSWFDSKRTLSLLPPIPSSLCTSLPPLILHFPGVFSVFHKVPVKYTDIDYSVFNDAAVHVQSGGSPYDRGTYRYSPLMAYLMLPNAFYPEWGKMLFALCDVIAALLSAAILVLWRFPRDNETSVTQNNRLTESASLLRSSVLWSLLYLASPLAINISTRGSADAIVLLLLFVLLLLLLPFSAPQSPRSERGSKTQESTFAASLCSATRAVAPAAAVYGLVVHFRVYPIIYAPAVLFFLSNSQNDGHNSNQFALQHQEHRPLSSSSFAFIIKACFRSCLHHLTAPVQWCWRTGVRIATSPLCLAFAAVSAAVFLSLLGLFHALYGWTFVHETYLYHLVRKDIRHNFSPYFLLMYLSSAPAPALLALANSTAPAAAAAAATTVAAAVPTPAAAAALAQSASLISALTFGALSPAAAAAVSASGFHAASAAASESVCTALSRLPVHAYALVVQLAPVFVVFLPQAALLLLTAARLSCALPACFLVQTLIFVSFNKVCTAQYFLWWSALLPLALPAACHRARPLRAAAAVAAAAALWQGTEAHWLYWGYQLEVLSLPVYTQMWLAAMLFFAVNVALIVVMIAKTKESGIEFGLGMWPWEASDKADCQQSLDVSGGICNVNVSTSDIALRQERRLRSRARTTQAVSNSVTDEEVQAKDNASTGAEAEVVRERKRPSQRQPQPMPTTSQQRAQPRSQSRSRSRVSTPSTATSKSASTRQQQKESDAGEAKRKGRAQSRSQSRSRSRSRSQSRSRAAAATRKTR